MLPAVAGRPRRASVGRKVHHNDFETERLSPAATQDDRRRIESSFTHPTSLIPAHIVTRHVINESIHTFPLEHPLSADIIHLIMTYAPPFERSASVHFMGRRFGTINAEHQSGMAHADTVYHDLFSDDIQSKLLRGWNVSRIIGMGNEYANGVAFVYHSNKPAAPNQQQEEDVVASTSAMPLSSSSTLSTALHNGDHHWPQRSDFSLTVSPVPSSSSSASLPSPALCEYVSGISMHHGVWIDCLKFHTSAGRTFKIGRSETPPLYFVNNPSGIDPIRIVGLICGVGGHIHNIGYYYERMYTVDQANKIYATLL